MAVQPYLPEGLLAFLRQASTEGLLNPAVAKSRYQAVEHVFTELNASERLDIRLIDVDAVCAKLHKLEGSSIRPEVVALYRDRVRAALTDYLAWVDNPQSFASVGGDPLRRDRRGVVSSKEAAAEAAALEEIVLSSSERKPELVSIPLRANLAVFIAGLPLDLTATEARKIARVVEAFAEPDRAR